MSRLFLSNIIDHLTTRNVCQTKLFTYLLTLFCIFLVVDLQNFTYLSKFRKFEQMNVGCRSGLCVRLVNCWSWVRAQSKVPIESLSKKLYPYCLVLVGSSIGFEHDFKIAIINLRALWKIDVNIKLAHSLNMVKTYTNCYLYLL